MIELFLTGSLAFIMFSLGLSLKPQDFGVAFHQPKALIAGAISQLLMLPLIAFVLLRIFDLQGDFALGIMILSCCPGGITSSIVTKLSRGDVALSISLTAIISLISIISVPFIVFKSAELLEVTEFSKEISMIGISMKMFLVVTLPVLIGMLIRKFATNFVMSKSQLIERISVLLFVIVFAAI